MKTHRDRNWLSEQECCSEEESLESLHAQVVSLIRLLEEDSADKVAEVRELTEPVLPSPEPLLTQFASRPCFVLVEVDDERLSSSYWLAPLPVDEADQDTDQVTCDLMSLVRAELPSFNLPGEAERCCRKLLPTSGSSGISHDDSAVMPIPKRASAAGGVFPVMKFPPRGIENKKINKRPYVTSMRGRGFGRPAPGPRGDLFRSRPPNTSRPPSLHVDDFVALEITGHQPTGPTGYNKISMRVAKEMMVGRSRGRGRAFTSERGRFFGQPGPYGRREGARGAARGGMQRGRGGAIPNWAPRGEPGLLNQRFRTPEPRVDNRDVRMLVHSEEKFPVRNFGGRGRGAMWTSGRGKDRERFGGPPIRLSDSRGRREINRHPRSFTR